MGSSPISDDNTFFFSQDMDCRSTFFRLAQDITSQACKGELHIGMWPPICWCILVESKAGFLFIFSLFQIKWFFECVSLKF